MNHEESKLQQACVSWFRAQYPQYAMLLVHPINEGSGHTSIDRRRQGIHKAEGAVAGVPDLILFSRQSLKSLLTMIWFGKRSFTDLESSLRLRKVTSHSNRRTSRRCLRLQVTSTSLCGASKSSSRPLMNTSPTLKLM